jgi:predicted NBD/HSP70 family sugar kinase
MKGTAWLRQQNEKRTLAYLREHPICTRQEIGNALGVSKNTVSLIIDKFIEEGAVRETGIDEQGSVGRPRKKLSLIMDVYKSIGIFVQKSTVQYVVTDYASNILEEGEIPLPTHRAELCLEELTKVCKDLLQRHQEALGIGLGIPGLVDPLTGIVHFSSHLGWSAVSVRDTLSSHLSKPVKVLNSVKASALTPMSLIVERPIHSAFYIHIDKGVGGALVIGNDLFHGVSSTAGEIGHLTVQPDGPLCTCGRNGCLEALVSVPNITKAIAGGLSLPEIIEQGYGKHKVFQERGVYLGIAISQIIHLFNPQYVIVDTPLQKIDTFQEGAIRTIKEQTLQFPLEHTQVLFAHTRFGAARGAALAIILDFEQDLLDI